jgi:hypothetical protein
MPRSIHPYPIVGATKTLIVFVILALALFVVRDFLGDYFVPFFIALGFIGTLLVLLPFIAARFHTLLARLDPTAFRRGLAQYRHRWRL